MWALGGLCDRFLGEKFSNLFYELMEGDLSPEIRQELGITVQVSGVQVENGFIITWILHQLIMHSNKVKLVAG